MKSKKTLYSQTILSEKNTTGDITLPNFKIYSKATVWHWQVFIFNKGAKNTQWGRDSLSSIVLRRLDSNIQNNKIGPLS